MKKLIVSILVVISLFGGYITPVIAQENTINLTLFHRDDCPHCQAEWAFLNQLQNEYPNLEISDYEVTKDKEAIPLLKEIAKQLNVQVSGVPFTVVGDQYVIGYLNDETTGAQIKKLIEQCNIEGCVDVASLVGDIDAADVPSSDGAKEIGPITLPIFGTIDVAQWSLPALTIVIGLLDGFNPCAMWTLIFLITLLLGMQDRKKMWILGGAFIFTSGFIYFLFLAAWLNVFLFVGFLTWIRITIGAVAIGSGVYHLREFWKNKDGACKVGDAEQKRKIMDKFRAVTEQKKFLLALAGIISIAIAVNMIELICSAGLPAIYTQILSLANLSTPAYYGYLLLYILLYMLDDMLVFAIAMKTLQVAGMTGKYTRWSNLVGGILIFLLGVLLIFRPEWITFG